MKEVIKNHIRNGRMRQAARLLMDNKSKLSRTEFEFFVTEMLMLQKQNVYIRHSESISILK